MIEIEQRTSYEDWLSEGKQLRDDDRNRQFRIGDWLNEYEPAWGNMYEDAHKQTGLDESVLREYKSVAASVKLLLRNNNLSYSHHKVVAPYNGDQQKFLLMQAATLNLSVAQFREQKDRLLLKRLGKYSCLVVDPPWPMQKIEREVRPNQVGFDYETMSEEELKAFPLPDIAADDCHLYLWTTQKYLPFALRLAEHWGFRYQCLLTWVKNVGFTPFSWMYSTEHALFCTRGNLPLLKQGKRLDFTAKVREHSRKPDEFYALVSEVSPEPRIDVFSREKREGFDQYGNEVEKFV